MHQTDTQPFEALDADVDDILLHLGPEVRNERRVWPDTLAELVDVVADHLERREGQSRDQARAGAQDLIVVLAHHFGGRRLYLPCDKPLRLALRDLQIWRDFDGRNIAVLESRWKLSRQQVYNIIAVQRRRHKNRRQEIKNQMVGHPYARHPG